MSTATLPPGADAVERGADDRPPVDDRPSHGINAPARRTPGGCPWLWMHGRMEKRPTAAFPRPLMLRMWYTESEVIP